MLLVWNTEDLFEHIAVLFFCGVLSPWSEGLRGVFLEGVGFPMLMTSHRSDIITWAHSPLVVSICKNHLKTTCHLKVNLTWHTHGQEVTHRVI